MRLSEVRPQAVSFELGGEGQSLDGGQLQGGQGAGTPTDRQVGDSMGQVIYFSFSG